MRPLGRGSEALQKGLPMTDQRLLVVLVALAGISFAGALIASTAPTAAMSVLPASQLAPEVQDRLDHARAELDGVKSDLPGYQCCINPACNFCALATGVCPCAANLTTAGVCGECLLGWHAGRGHAEGVEADQVKTLSGPMLAAMYDKLAENFSGHVHEHQD